MFCPNCGVEINTLEKCEICGVDLQFLQRLNLVKDTPPKNNYSNISAYARSLKSRRMSVDKFLEEQKAYLSLNQKTQSVDSQQPANTNENKFNFASAQGRSIFGDRSKVQNTPNQNTVSNQTQPVQNNQPTVQPQPVFNQPAQNLNANGFETQQTGQPVQPQPDFQPQFQQNTPPMQQPQVQQPQPVQNPNSQVYLKEEDFVKDEFEIPKINGAGAAPQASENVNQNIHQQAPVQQAPTQSAKPQPSETHSTYDEFVIPAINAEKQEENAQANNNINLAEQAVQQANQLSVENNKKIQKLKTGKKPRSRCASFALVLAILACVATILYFVLNNVEINVEFIKVAKKFVLANQKYFIWGIMGVGILSILFMLIGLISGKTKTKWIAMILILFLLGAVAYYLYSEKLLISGFNDFIALFKK